MLKWSRKDRPASPRARRRRAGIGLGAFLMAVAATIPWYDLPDAAHFRRLVRAHEAGAAECRRLVAPARAAGDPAEARRLDRSARQHDWFAEAYRGELARSRLNLIELIGEGVRRAASSFGPFRLR